MSLRRPPLSQHGAARQRFAELRPAAAARAEGDACPEPGRGDLGRFFRQLRAGAVAHDLGDDSLYLAEEVVGMTSFLSERERRALALALLASMVAVRRGCTRLPLGGGARGAFGHIVAALLKDTGTDLEPRKVMADIESLARSVTFDRLIGAAGEARPLVVDGDYLYQHRMLACENALVDRLRRRLAAGRDTAAGVDAAVERAVADAPFPLSDEQRAAVTAALSRDLTIVTGGPGTGKTAIVQAVVRAAGHLGLTADDIALAAPTGKAVVRMAGAVADLDASPEPRTLHRLLGYLPSTRNFRHHENHPIAARLVVVDEASMVDLALMERLLAALPADAALVLLGDADQLPSVDAGAVLRDLVAALPGHTARLTRSYRMNPDDPAGSAILTAAAAVGRGEPPRLADAVRMVDTGARPAAVDRFLDAWFDQHIAGDPERARRASRVYRADRGVIADDDAGDVTALLEAIDRRRLLAVTRRQATGADAINRRLHRRVLATASVTGAPELYPGEPVMVRSNDYERGLFNGDQGVILRVGDGSGRHHFRAVFPSPDGYRVFHLEAVRVNLDLAYAMTVHKSQGSEFDHVALVLPTRDVPLCTRELLYTAITRARRSVTLVGTSALLRIAANRTIERLSGVADKLR